MRAWLFAGLVACSYQSPSPATSDDAVVDSATDIDGTRIDGAIDAPGDIAIDAPPFDPATDCPVEYTIAFAGLKSRYRASTSTETWPTYHADCANDLPGKTHMVVFEDANELSTLATQPMPRFLVGHFQMANQQTVDANWFTVTGDAVDPALWLGGQPNDDGGGEQGDQDRAFLNYTTGTGVQDGPPSFDAEGMCECDGKPIPPAIEAML